jgi:hypothetical protein
MHCNVSMFSVLFHVAGELQLQGLSFNRKDFEEAVSP